MHRRTQRLGQGCKRPNQASLGQPLLQVGRREVHDRKLLQRRSQHDCRSRGRRYVSFDCYHINASARSYHPTSSVRSCFFRVQGCEERMLRRREAGSRSELLAEHHLLREPQPVPFLGQDPPDACDVGEGGVGVLRWLLGVCCSHQSEAAGGGVMMARLSSTFQGKNSKQHVVSE